jgi:hypothetical protein
MLRHAGSKMLLVTAAILGMGRSLAQTSPEPVPAKAREIANVIGLAPLMERISRLPEASPEAETTRQSVLARVMDLSLQIDAVVAQIEHERTELDEARQFLERRRARAVIAAQTAAIVIGSGLGIGATAMQFFDETTSRAGKGIAIGAGVLAAGFGIASLVVRRRGRSPIEVDLTMLAPLLDRSPAPGSEYPAAVWRCMEPWRGEIVSEWKRVGRMSVGSDDARPKIDLLTSRIGREEPVSIAVLVDRAAMLADVRARVLQMKRELALLTRTLDRPAASGALDAN